MNELNLHPEAELIESYLEGTLEEAQRAVFESHLVSCERCQIEVEDWRGLFGALDALPPIEPPPGFADRIMAHVIVLPSPARTAAAVRWLPQTTKGWSLVAAALALPVLGIGSALAWILTQPWATTISAQAVLVFAWSRASAGLSWVGARATSLVLQTEVVRTLAAGLRRFLAVAGTTGLGLAAIGFCLAALGSAWVLYHNLVRNSTRELNYAPYTL